MLNVGGGLLQAFNIAIFPIQHLIVLLNRESRISLFGEQFEHRVEFRAAYVLQKRNPPESPVAASLPASERRAGL